MRHRRKIKKFNRDTKHRQALFKNQLRQLVIYGSITTTKPKAKQLKKLMDKAVYKAKDNSVASRRNLHRLFGNRRVVNILVDEIASLYPAKQTGGFTSITQLANRRGDNAPLVRLSLTQTREGNGSLKRVPKKPTKQKTAPKSKKSKEDKASKTKARNTKVKK